MRKESVIMLISVVILTVPTAYFLITLGAITSGFMTLHNPHIVIDSSMNLNLLYNGGSLDLGSIITFIFALLSSVVFALLLALLVTRHFQKS